MVEGVTVFAISFVEKGNLWVRLVATGERFQRRWIVGGRSSVAGTLRHQLHERLTGE